MSITPDEAVAYLNELIELDRPAMAALIANRVPCNVGLAQHPTCQVGSQHGGFHVGLIGVINGMFGVDGMDARGWGPITWVFEEGNLVRVTRTAK